MADYSTRSPKTVSHDSPKSVLKHSVWLGTPYAYADVPDSTNPEKVLNTSRTLRSPKATGDRVSGAAT
jgi:hypothetical protein